MFHYDYKTENTCSQVISLNLDGNIVHNVSFMGGCNGKMSARLMKQGGRYEIQT